MYITAESWHKQSHFYALLKPTKRCQLSKSERRDGGGEGGAGYMLIKRPAQFSSLLVQVNDTHSWAIYQRLFDPG